MVFQQPKNLPTITHLLLIQLLRIKVSICYNANARLVICVKGPKLLPRSDFWKRSLLASGCILAKHVYDPYTTFCTQYGSLYVKLHLWCLLKGPYPVFICHAWIAASFVLFLYFGIPCYTKYILTHFANFYLRNVTYWNADFSNVLWRTCAGTGPCSGKTCKLQ